jgi:hypothetical protein
MKKIVLLIMIALFFSSCGGSVTPEDMRISEKICGESGLSRIYIYPNGRGEIFCCNGLRADMNKVKGE